MMAKRSQSQAAQSSMWKSPHNKGLQATPVAGWRNSNLGGCAPEPRRYVLNTIFLADVYYLTNIKEKIVAKGRDAQKAVKKKSEKKR